MIPRGPGAICLLVHNPAEDPAELYGPGWSVVAWQGSTWCWSTPLAAHGAGTHTGVRAAQAVAARLLAKRGAPVGGWLDGARGGLAMFRPTFTHRPPRWRRR